METAKFSVDSKRVTGKTKRVREDELGIRNVTDDVSQPNHNLCDNIKKVKFKTKKCYNGDGRNVHMDGDEGWIQV